jgi:hypothetical protein
MAAKTEEPCDVCEYSLVPGVLFPWNSDEDIAGVERCDQCAVFVSDDDAAAALAKVLGPDYEVVYSYTLQRIVVRARGAASPLTFRQGMALVQRRRKKRK